MSVCLEEAEIERRTVRTGGKTSVLESVAIAGGENSTIAWFLLA